MKTMNKVLMMGILLGVSLLLFSCDNDEPTVTYNYKSLKYGIEVNLPEGWAAAEGADLEIMHQEGLVSFNSWGQDGFWARAKTTYNSDGTLSSATFDPYVVAAQIPKGGAYIALVATSGMPHVGDKPDEYTRNDLRDLYEFHDWRRPNGVYFKNFYKADTSLTLTVVCSQNATDETVNQINGLLESWRFGDFSNNNN